MQDDSKPSPSPTNSESEPSKPSSDIPATPSADHQSLPPSADEPTPTQNDTITSEAPTDVPASITSAEPITAPAVSSVITPEKPVVTPSVAPQDAPLDKPEVDAAEPTVPGAEKPHRLRALLAILVVIVLLGGAAFAAYHFSQPKQQVASTVTKKEVPVLKIGINDGLPTSYYPDVALETASQEVTYQIFDGLTAVADNTKIVPALATSWTTPTPTTWLFKLRQGVYFHNGHLMTAQLVKASLDSAHDSDTWQTFGINIKAVDVVDSQTIKITTNGPDPLLTNELSKLPIFDTSSGKQNDPGNGTGAYTIKPGTSETLKEIDLVAYDKYWAGKPWTKEVDFIYYDNDDSVIAALKQNKIDLGNITDYASFAKLGSAFKQQTVFAPQVLMLLPNIEDKTSPLSKLDVRQAVYLSLDPVKLSAARGDHGTPTGQIVPQEIPGYDASIKRPANDLTKAKSLLADAGYPNGFTIKLSYYYTSDNLVDEIQKELAQVGITVVKDRRTDGQQYQADALGGHTQLSSLSYTTDLLDISDVINTLLIGGGNYSNPQLTKLNDEAATQLNQAKRLQDLQAMNRLIANDLALMPIDQSDNTPFALRSDSKLVLKQQVTDTDTGLYFYQVYSK